MLGTGRLDAQWEMRRRIGCTDGVKHPLKRIAHLVHSFEKFLIPALAKPLKRMVCGFDIDVLVYRQGACLVHKHVQRHAD